MKRSLLVPKMFRKSPDTADRELETTLVTAAKAGLFASFEDETDWGRKRGLALMVLKIWARFDQSDTMAGIQ